MQDAKHRKKSPSGHHRTTLSGYIFPTKARVDDLKKNVKQQYLPHMSIQYGELEAILVFDVAVFCRNRALTARKKFISLLYTSFIAHYRSISAVTGEP